MPRATLYLIVALATPGATSAQTVIGRLLEAGSERPIALGSVALLDTSFVIVEQVFTNSEGDFRILAPGPGSFYVMANRLGYRRGLDGILELGKGGLIEITFYLRPAPLVLDSLLARGERRFGASYLEDVGFYDRMKLGFGNFITPESIASRPPFTVRDLFRNVPGVHFTENPLVGTTILLSARGPIHPGGSGFCQPQVYIDGLPAVEGPPIRGVAGTSSVVIEDHVNLESIEAVEIYRGAASIPIQWARMGASCGVVLIWTKH